MQNNELDTEKITLEIKQEYSTAEPCPICWTQCRHVISKFNIVRKNV